MKYGLQAVEDNENGKTTLYVKSDKLFHLATIPWKRGGRTTLYLHPENIAQVTGPVAPDIDVAAQEAMPVFAADELATVVSTVQNQSKAIQAQDRKTFTPLPPPPKFRGEP